MNKALSILLFFAFSRLWAQTPDPQVINSAGGTRTAANGISITDNVGEPFSQTLGPVGQLMITQGYLQPYVSPVIPGFIVNLLKNDITCSDKTDGSVALDIRSGIQNFTASYFWSPASICPNNNCLSVNNLPSGDYSVSVIITYTGTGGVVKQDSSFKLTANVADPHVNCLIDIVHGVTANSDGINDTWIIGNINVYKKNKVSIFNRWGVEVYSAESYDNTTKVWVPDNKVASSTYFYIIDLGDGSKPYKGWVEVIKD